MPSMTRCGLRPRRRGPTTSLRVALSATLTSLVNAGITSPILYWDNSSVSLSASDFPATFLRGLDNSGTCSSNSVTIVVAGPGHDLTYQGGNTAPLPRCVDLRTRRYALPATVVGTPSAPFSQKRSTLAAMSTSTWTAASPTIRPARRSTRRSRHWREDDSKDIN